jgi:cytochrome c peroxidase
MHQPLERLRRLVVVVWLGGLVAGASTTRTAACSGVAMRRNIAMTAPCFHDGAVGDLPTAVQGMARTQLGEPLPATAVDEIVAFLASLTGDVPAHDAPPPAAK